MHLSFFALLGVPLPRHPSPKSPDKASESEVSRLRTPVIGFSSLGVNSVLCLSSQKAEGDRANRQREP